MIITICVLYNMYMYLIHGISLYMSSIKLPSHICPSLSFNADKCGDTIKITSPSYLTSAGYPHSYPPSQRCEWLIQAPEHYQRIMINFNPHFDLEDRECK
ncbi:hypothetical protein XELAEV_18001972mg [Xenopus laevis]|uniref:CUB domain-containing protein n=1 Tax=Xenopus laevis TaxID=8355 RepID=A0A974GYE6_XENLA|nr:hypothetical protein XELAEV_18001972mg [Xenopus laevis]